MRHDIGRVLVETFKQPEAYKNTWLSVVNAWYSFDEIVHKIEEMSSKTWKVEKAATDMKTPILHLAEQNSWDIIPLEATRTDSLIELENFDVIIKRYADLLA